MFRDKSCFTVSLSACFVHFSLVGCTYQCKMKGSYHVGFMLLYASCCCIRWVVVAVNFGKNAIFLTGALKDRMVRSITFLLLVGRAEGVDRITRKCIWLQQNHSLHIAIMTFDV